MSLFVISLTCVFGAEFIIAPAGIIDMLSFKIRCIQLSNLTDRIAACAFYRDATRLQHAVDRDGNYQIIYTT